MEIKDTLNRTALDDAEHMPSGNTGTDDESRFPYIRISRSMAEGTS